MEIEDINQKIEKLKLEPENAGNGLVQLVLALVNMVRQLMEKQAIRKIESEELTEEQIENIGCTFLALDEKIEALKTQFNLTDEDLEIDLKKYIRIDEDSI